MAALIQLNDLAIWVQAAAAVAIVGATVWLAVINKRYVKITNEALEISRRQFAQDWQPDLRIAEVQRLGSLQVFLRLANLAKPAALIRQIKIGTGGRSQGNHPPQGVETYPKSLLVPGGQISEQIWIHSELSQYREKYKSATKTAQ